MISSTVLQYAMISWGSRTNDTKKNEIENVTDFITSSRGLSFVCPQRIYTSATGTLEL